MKLYNESVYEPLESGKKQELIRNMLYSKHVNASPKKEFKNKVHVLNEHVNLAVVVSFAMFVLCA